MDSLVVVAVVTVAGTIATGVIGALLGRRWGLPGLGREVQTQQAALIATLQAELSELRAQQVVDDKRIKALEATEAKLKEQLSAAEERIGRQQAELINLYRMTGKRVPNAF